MRFTFLRIYFWYNNLINWIRLPGKYSCTITYNLLTRLLDKWVFLASFTVCVKVLLLPWQSPLSFLKHFEVMKRMLLWDYFNITLPTQLIFKTLILSFFQKKERVTKSDQTYINNFGDNLYFCVTHIYIHLIFFG